MEYNFREIEKKWQTAWKESGIYHVSNVSDKPKYYVLDMFPYPSGAGLHVGHPLGYIASDIFARYKRLKGFNVLHPMGFDSFGLPAEQYAIETGQHPVITTEKNIATFKDQLDKIGFCFDWSREIKTSDPEYYRWTQWIFLQIFNSWFNRKTKKAESIESLVEVFENKGTKDLESTHSFSGEEWNRFDEKKKQEILMDFRLAFSSYGEVNWCEALGTVLANDEVVNGVSERGGFPVEKKKMRQWYLRITDYAERLLEGLETVDFSEAMKEMQRNWIGRSEGAEMQFAISLTPNPSPKGEEDKTSIQTDNKKMWPELKDLSRENRKEKTPAEDKLWQRLRNNQYGSKVRRQHVIDGFIVDFAFLNEKLLIEVDGEYHNGPEQKKYDESRTEYLQSLGYRLIRFSNDDVINNFTKVSETIKKELAFSPLSARRGDGGEAKTINVYTTRPDTIFGVDFLVLAPEHELVNEITSEEQRSGVNEYLDYVKSRSDRERMAEVKQITGCFTGAYAINPFNGRKVPIWIAEYVLSGYGTGAIMAVPCGDQRDFDFATHFNIPITNIIGDHFNGKEANPTKEAVLQNSGFLNGMLMKDAIGAAIEKIEELKIGKRKVNYRMRDAGFSRQRYWGEPFPIIWSDGVAIPLEEKELPLELPFVEKYGPGKNGEGPLSNLADWVNVVLDDDQYDFKPRTSSKESGEGLLGFKTTEASRWKKLKPFARENRKDSTEAESNLWEILRNRKIDNCKFRRQHAIDRFIVDFVCLEKMLVIEVDGGYHLEEEQKNYDKSRSEFLKEHGFSEITFSNEEIKENLPEVISKISAELQSRSPLPGRGVRGKVKHGKRETSTMPGYAGSSWYFLRYMDPHNNETFADKKASDYWNQVDVYIGGTEHAVGHLLYSRLWTKILCDLGYISFDEPYKKLVNQGMIQGSSRFVYRYLSNYGGNVKSEEPDLPLYISKNIIDNIEKGAVSEKIKNDIINIYSHRGIVRVDPIQYFEIHVDVNIVDGVELDIEAFKKSKPEYANAKFILEDGKYICGVETEKMSKSKYNTVNPNDLVDKYGADTFRMYEMFLGPVEQSKPWDTKGIEGVHRFLKKLWRLFYDDSSPLSPGRGVAGEASAAELKSLHKTIKKIEEDTERFSFNTAVSAFMVCVNELTDLKCHKKEILEPLLILLAPYAPHISEELFHALGNTSSVLDAPFPKLENKYLVESEKEYPISVNGKLRTTIVISLEASQQEVEKIVLHNQVIQKWIDGKTVKKIIFIKNKMVNVVV